MAAYSLDLRERIINAVERGDQTKRAVAALFEVHESFIYKLLRQQREAGHLAPLPHGGGQTAKLQEEQLAVLADLVAQTPDATLDELATQLYQKKGVEVGRTTLWRGLQRLDLSRKKRPKSLLKPIR
jgi:transposase